MKNSSYYSRQNHKKALTYLKSSLYCFKKEKQFMYLVIISSIAFCFLGIVFSMLPKVFDITDKGFNDMCKNAVKYIGFCSGIFLVAQLFIKIVSSRIHIEAINSIERFDNYVYNLSPNRMIMRPMTEAQLENNASKIPASDSTYANTYFSSDTIDDPILVYNNQREIFVNEYHLMLYVKARFFNILWISFPLIIFIFALAVEDSFFNTLLNIFFPSISIISLIVSSLLVYNKSMRFLQNTLTQFEAAEKDPDIDKRSELVLRQNQDAIFQYRMSAFNIPMFLIRRYEKSEQKQLREALAIDYTSIPKTSPFITAEFEAQQLRRKNAQSQRKNSSTRPEQNLKEQPKANKESSSKTSVAENKAKPAKTKLADEKPKIDKTKLADEKPKIDKTKLADEKPKSTRNRATKQSIEEKPDAKSTQKSSTKK